MKSEEWIRSRISDLYKINVTRGNDQIDRILSVAENAQIQILEEVLED